MLFSPPVAGRKSIASTRLGVSSAMAVHSRLTSSMRVMGYYNNHPTQIPQVTECMWRFFNNPS